MPTQATQIQPEHKVTSSDRDPRNDRVKQLINWTFFAGACLYSVFHAGFVVLHTVRESPWLMRIVVEHFAAIVALPFAGFAALGLVLFLDSRSEHPLEFKAFGFEFKGASGQIVLWMISFMAVTASIKALW